MIGAFAGGICISLQAIIRKQMQGRSCISYSCTLIYNMSPPSNACCTRRNNCTIWGIAGATCSNFLLTVSVKKRNYMNQAPNSYHWYNKRYLRIPAITSRDRLRRTSIPRISRCVPFNEYHSCHFSTSTTHKDAVHFDSTTDSSIPPPECDAVLMSELLQRTGDNVDQESTQIPEKKRRLDIAIVGLPNAGKSQLLNVLTGVPISAVSRKRHTTRKGILAARTVVQTNRDDQDNNKPLTKITTQLLFVDTPGFVHTGPSSLPNQSSKPSSETLRKDSAKVSNVEKLDRDLMVAEARREMVAVDYTILVIDAARRCTADVRATLVELMMSALSSRGRIEDTNDDDEGDDDDEDSDVDEDVNSDNSKTNDKHSRTHDDFEDEKDLVFPHQKFAIVLNKVDLIHPKQALLEYAFELGDIAQECLHYHIQYELQQQQQQKEQSHDSTGTSPPNISKATMPPLDESLLAEVMPTFFYTSALKNEGVDDLLNFLLLKATPTEVFEVEPGNVTNLLPEERATEIIREKIYRCLHKELPYQIQQENRTFKVSKITVNGEEKFRLYIEQDLLVMSRSHQELVRGRGSATLERIRESAEYTMKIIFKCDVTLKLNVKFKKNNNASRREVEE